MIIIRLAGGLGNQIFQIVVGILIAQKSDIKKIQIDDSALSNYDEKRNNELFKFLDFNKLEIEIVFKNNSITKLRLPKLLPLNMTKNPFVSDKNFQTVFDSPNKIFMIIDGYFQECLTQDNFDDEIDILKNIFIQNDFEKKDGCVIHIRGGDFVKLGWNSVTPKEYYIKAIETMQTMYNQDKFYIVTDDKDYSKDILDNFQIKYEFIGNSMYEDFYLIGSFRYRILSSSTFALWASALADNEDSVVIAPKYWTPDNERKIYLPNEERINYE
jgi:hypothetical protein